MATSGGTGWRRFGVDSVLGRTREAHRRRPGRRHDSPPRRCGRGAERPRTQRPRKAVDPGPALHLDHCTSPASLRTQPASPWRTASRWTKGRKPTPCTTPVTSKRTARDRSDGGRHADRRGGPALAGTRYHWSIPSPVCADVKKKPSPGLTSPRNGDRLVHVEGDVRKEIDLVEHHLARFAKHVRVLERLVLALGHREDRRSWPPRPGPSSRDRPGCRRSR